MSSESTPAAPPVRSVAARWAAPVFWLAVILVGTSWPGISVGPDELGFDKVVHFTMYGVLTALVLRSARTPRTLATYVAVVAAIACLGALDEWHQQFIPNRSMSLYDWMADTSGALVGATAARFLPFLQPRALS